MSDKKIKVTQEEFQGHLLNQARVSAARKLYAKMLRSGNPGVRGYARELRAIVGFNGPVGK